MLDKSHDFQTLEDPYPFLKTNQYVLILMGDGP